MIHKPYLKIKDRIIRSTYPVSHNKEDESLTDEVTKTKEVEEIVHVYNSGWIMVKVIKYTAVPAAILISALLLAVAIRDSFDLPTVYTSNSTGECVRVEGPGDLSCINLPSKYHRVWVR